MIPALVAEEVRETLLDYLRTTWALADHQLEAALLGFLSGAGDGRGNLFKGPYLRLRLPFAPAPEGTPAPLSIAPAYAPYLHQLLAWQRLASDQPGGPQATLVTTGTGSGKTECFLYPLLDHCHRMHQAGVGGIKAIVLYPMNALAADQARRMAEVIHEDPRTRGRLRVGMYVGGEGRQREMGASHVIDHHGALREAPPDILLTNYRMLDLLLLRPKDQALWSKNRPGTLRYLVLDELHTYDGAQGTDVACLIRRLSARLGGDGGAGEPLCAVGTSATVASDAGESQQELLDFASKVFDQPFEPSSLIGEARLSPDQLFARDVAGQPELPQRYPADLEALEPTPQADAVEHVTESAAIWFGAVAGAESPPWATPGLGVGAGRAALANWVLRLPLARAVIRAASQRIVDGAELDREVSALLPEFAALEAGARQKLLVSVLSLLSWSQSRLQVSGAARYAPLVHVQVQLWIREARRLLREVRPGHHFLWGDEHPQGKGYAAQLVGMALAGAALPTAPLTAAQLAGGSETACPALPMYYCRECGHSGWLTCSDDLQMTDRISLSYDLIARAALDRDPHTIYLHTDPNISDEPDNVLTARYYDPKTSSLVSKAPAGPNPLRVYVYRSLNQAGDKDAKRCPACAANGGLTFLASRSASLASVAVGHLYTTPLNTDRKLLAFSDSVQDASHRAGFFSGRTYRFSVRSAMLAVVPDVAAGGAAGGAATGGAAVGGGVADSAATDGSAADGGAADGGAQDPVQGSIRLSDLAPRMFEYWRQHPSAGAERFGAEAAMLAAFLPHDLEYLADYQEYVSALSDRTRRLQEAEARGEDLVLAAVAPHPRLLRDLERRMRWEVTRELGVATRIGRTLERSGCASVTADPERMQRALELVQLHLPERLGVAQGIGPAALRQFVVGLLNRLRARGGIYDELLQQYFESGGKTFYLSKRMQPLLSPFGPNVTKPLFLSNQEGEFDNVAPKDARNWYSDWVERALGLALPLGEVRDVYATVLPYLVQARLLKEHSVAKRRVWGLEPEALFVSRRHCVRVCDRCAAEQHAVEGGPLDPLNMCCLRYRCEGRMGPKAEERSRSASYYQRFYQRRTLGRVWSREHTGLLERRAREDLELEFKHAPRPDAPNMLSCTPTLEMGIDIGDLSATMLCSVPPSTASYLQRVGRAGRSTGNALILTFASTQQHDLYFYDDPEAVMAGAIRPPGCYLDAPEVLKRQALAFCLDRWAQEGQAVPARVRELLGSNPSGFPANLFEFIHQRREALRRGFFELFDRHAIREESRQKLDKLFNGAAPGASQLEQRLALEVEAARTRADELKARFKRTNEKKKKLESDEAERKKLDDPEEAILDLRSELGFLRAELDGLLDHDVWGWLCDESLLPNYAFPEAGVKLRAYVRKELPQLGPGQGAAPTKKATKGRGKDNADSQAKELVWVRAPSSAISELAPFNTFYGSGHKVRIDNIDLKRSGSVGKWQFCAACHYMLPVAELGSAPKLAAAAQADHAADGAADGQVADQADDDVADDDAAVAACPACNAPGWGERGRQRELVRMTQVRAFTRERDAVVSDEREDRERAYYETHNFYDTSGEKPRNTWTNEALGFGFELLPKVKLRRINFGQRDPSAPAAELGGQEVPEVSFKVCADCGQVQEPKPDKGRARVNKPHRGACPSAPKAEAKQNFKQIHLVRELESEGVRLVLPVSAVEASKRIANIRAALRLGLREFYGGEPEFLAVDTYDEPAGEVQGAEGQARKHYLLIQDMVPGGTGLLAELTENRGAKLKQVLEKAYEQVRRCSCASRVPAVKACYRCLYAYREQRHLHELDREVAAELLEDMLKAFTDLRARDSLADLSVASLLESELERRVYAVMTQHWPAREEDLSVELLPGERLRLTFEASPLWPKRSWLVKPQVELGEDEVLHQCRPDLLLYPEPPAEAAAAALKEAGWGLARPVALFADGAAYHVMPHQQLGRLADDFKKRAGIVSSRRYITWSLAWDDVNAYSEGDELAPWIDNGQIDEKLKRFCGALRLSNRDAAFADPLRGLLGYLRDPSRWDQLAGAFSAAALHTLGRQLPAQRVDETLGALRVREQPKVKLLDSQAGSDSLLWLTAFGGQSEVVLALAAEKAAGGRLHADATLVQGVLRLDDQAEKRSHDAFISAWRQFLRAYNLLQFLPNVAVVTQEQLSGADNEVAVLGAAKADAAGPAYTHPQTQLMAADVRARRVEELASAVRELLEELASDDVRGLVAEAAGAGFLEFQVPYELLGQRVGQETGSIEVGWPEQRVGLFFERERASAARLEAAGWRLFLIESDPRAADLVAALGAAPDQGDA